MDLELYGAVLRRYWGLLVAVIVVTVGLVWILSVSAPTIYEGSLFVSVAQRPELQQPDPATYQFGEFYAIQGSTFLADHLSGWLRDPATVQQLLVDADLSLPDPTLGKLAGYYKIDSLGRTGLKLSLISPESADITKGLEVAGGFLAEKLANLQRDGLYPEAVMTVGTPVVVAQDQSLELNLILGVITGCILGVILLLILSLAVPVRRQS